MSGMACTNQSKEEEDATELKLGEDFSSAAALSMNEVMLVCQSKVEDDAEAGGETSTATTGVFEKALAYCKRYANCSNQQQAAAMRDLCESAGLADFETAALANIMPQNADEARTLVPSLAARGEDGNERFSEEQIEALLNEMNNVRAFE